VYGFSLTGTKQWTDTFGCEGGGGATTVLNGSHLYLRGGNGGPGALIVSTATGVSSGTFGGAGVPAFDATNMYVVNGGVLDAADKSAPRRAGPSPVAVMDTSTASTAAQERWCGMCLPPAPCPHLTGSGCTPAWLPLMVCSPCPPLAS
jgi:hypothetical protein